MFFFLYVGSLRGYKRNCWFFYSYFEEQVENYTYFKKKKSFPYILVCIISGNFSHSITFSELTPEYISSVDLN